MPASELDDELDDEGEGTGKGLRAQLEAALKQNRQLAAKVRKSEVTELLTTKGFDLVKAEDLDGVDDKDIATRAETIQNERTELQTDLLRRALTAQGLEGDDLEALVTQTVNARKGDAATVAGVRAAANVPGTPASLVDTDQLHGRAAIEFGLANPSK